MSQLLMCMKCGGKVSSQAHKCPHCGTSDYVDRFIGECVVCCKPVKNSESIQQPYRLSVNTTEDGGYYPVQAIFHLACFEKVKWRGCKIKLTCRLCKAVSHYIYDDYTWDNDPCRDYSTPKNRYVSCSECGERFHPPIGKIESCLFCYQILNWSIETYIERQYSIISRKVEFCGRYAHRICASARKLPTDVRFPPLL